MLRKVAGLYLPCKGRDGGWKRIQYELANEERHVSDVATVPEYSTSTIHVCSQYRSENIQLSSFDAVVFWLAQFIELSRRKPLQYRHTLRRISIAVGSEYDVMGGLVIYGAPWCTAKNSIRFIYIGEGAQTQWICTVDSFFPIVPLEDEVWCCSTGFYAFQFLECTFDELCL